MLKKIFHFVGVDLRSARYFNIDHNAIHYHMYLVHNVTVFLCFFWILGLLADINLQEASFSKFFYNIVFPSAISDQYIQENQMKVIFWLFLPVSIFLSFVGALYFFTPHFQKQCKGKEITTKIGKNIFFAVLYFTAGLIFSLAILWGGYITLFGLMTSLGSHQYWFIITLQTLFMAKIYGIFSCSTSTLVQLFLFFFQPLVSKT